MCRYYSKPVKQLMGDLPKARQRRKHFLQKWRKPEENLQVGDLVIIKGIQFSTSQLAIRPNLSKVNPGEDKRVRVATVRTLKGLFK
ncbi:hypothetical protein CEXT_137261 [Caerostris extrusa]|uniref:DUF5641 domain-containing protein n=1 Tax=Caerostris extrusa TaxID=172846 RepID=A0AAV4YC75_CAEEX|nr:hypothetical protein CEXT_137261 [Caerostris extrusa]